MKLRHVLVSGVAVAATASVALVGSTSPASANDDTSRVTGSCGGSSDYTFTLSDSGAELRQQRLHYFINGKKGEGRVWTISVYEDGHRIYRTTRRTNNDGNVTVDRTFTADDDADIRVIAKAGYGETCNRVNSLD